MPLYYIAFMETIEANKDKEVRTEHIEYLNDLIQKGKIIAKGPFTDESGGLIIFTANSLEEAQQLAQNDPAALASSRLFTVREWKSSRELSGACEQNV
ncbi:YciI family protein [Aneurinibacillus sp. REN35]|uniref:YciI family protein n=1 Tax=Aneurinibacillus sp. REN35 TaxID=3237286 RepID=UPI003528745C